MMWVYSGLGLLNLLTGFLLVRSYKKQGELKANIGEINNELIDAQKISENLRQSLIDVQKISSKPVADSISSALSKLPNRSEKRDSN